MSSHNFQLLSSSLQYHQLTSTWILKSGSLNILPDHHTRQQGTQSNSPSSKSFLYILSHEHIVLGSAVLSELRRAASADFWATTVCLTSQSANLTQYIKCGLSSVRSANVTASKHKARAQWNVPEGDSQHCSTASKATICDTSIPYGCQSES